MTAEIISLDQARKEKHLRTLEEKRRLGEAVVFNMTLAEEAKILPFERREG